MKNTLIRIDPSKILRDVKPMHCVNNYPSFGDTFKEEFRALKIPYSRLHDTKFIEPHLVDIPAVFPDFDADETLESSYDFAFTDVFLARLREMGTEPFYRLGVSIENYRAIKPYWINPPKDFEKWARICQHVIAHYNEGWANGYHYGIKYWEVWNEPENYPDPAENQMWTGTFGEYMRLYEVTANLLKSTYPDIRIGGYASCGFYAIYEREIYESKFAPDAHISYRAEFFIECARKFLTYITSKEHHAPLDFFSWHSYSAWDDNVNYTRYVRKLLDGYGLTETESILNEWNPGTVYRTTLKDSSLTLSNMLVLQDEALDMLMYYDFRMNTAYCGAFDPVRIKPLKTYTGFRFFSELYQLGREAACTDEGDTGICRVAAYDGKKGAVVLSNPTGESYRVTLRGITPKTTEVLCEGDGFEAEKRPASDVLELGAYESALITY